MEDAKELIKLVEEYMASGADLPSDAPIKIYCEDDGIGNIVNAHNTKWPGDEGRNIEYIRKDVVERIIRGALGKQDALMKLKSL